MTGRPATTVRSVILDARGTISRQPATEDLAVYEHTDLIQLTDREISWGFSKNLYLYLEVISRLNSGRLHVYRPEKHANPELPLAR